MWNMHACVCETGSVQPVDSNWYGTMVVWQSRTCATPHATTIDDDAKIIRWSFSSPSISFALACPLSLSVSVRFLLWLSLSSFRSLFLVDCTHTVSHANGLRFTGVCSRVCVCAPVEYIRSHKRLIKKNHSWHWHKSSSKHQLSLFDSFCFRVVEKPTSDFDFFFMTFLFEFPSAHRQCDTFKKYHISCTFTGYQFVNANRIFPFRPISIFFPLKFVNARQKPVKSLKTYFFFCFVFSSFAYFVVAHKYRMVCAYAQPSTHRNTQNNRRSKIWN